MSILKRQREVKKAEKARMKRAKKHGAQEQVFTEPQPTVRFSDVGSVERVDEDGDDDEQEETEEEEEA